MKIITSRVAVLATAIVLSGALVAGIATAGSNEGSNEGPNRSAAAERDIVQTAVAAGQFKTLASLLQQADLAGTLSGAGPFTVFAPTDAAFKKVPKKTLAALAKDKDQLRAVLLYHVAGGKVPAKRVVKRTRIKTLNGASVRVRVNGRNVRVNKAKVVKTDVRASNGIIHVINRVLLPPSR